MVTKVACLISGGLDSTVLLAKAVNTFGSENVIALSIFYGQRHQKELECAKYQVKKYGVEWIQLDLSSIFGFSTSSLMSSSAKDIPEGTYEQQLKKEKIVDTYIPYRNGLFLSVAASLAYSKDAQYVYYGAHLDDAQEGKVAYPDCSKQFIQAQNKAIFMGTGSKVSVVAPYVESNMSKKDIVALGHTLNVDFAHTWSCYNKGKAHCGKCATCLDRIKAFQESYVEDPTLYESSISL